MKINTELIQQTFDTLKSNLLEVCTIDELTIDTLESKISHIRACIDVLDTVSLFIDDKDFINEFTAYNLVGNRLIDNSLDVFVMYVSDTEKKYASSLVQYLRGNGFRVDTEYTSRGLKGQFKQADRLNSKFLIILNDEDLPEVYKQKTASFIIKGFFNSFK